MPFLRRKFKKISEDDHEIPPPDGCEKEKKCRTSAKFPTNRLAILPAANENRNTLPSCNGGAQQSNSAGGKLLLGLRSGSTGDSLTFSQSQDSQKENRPKTVTKKLHPIKANQTDEQRTYRAKKVHEEVNKDPFESTTFGASDFVNELSTGINLCADNGVWDPFVSDFGDLGGSEAFDSTPSWGIFDNIPGEGASDGSKRFGAGKTQAAATGRGVSSKGNHRCEEQVIGKGIATANGNNFQSDIGSEQDDIFLDFKSVSHGKDTAPRSAPSPLTRDTVASQSGSVTNERPRSPLLNQRKRTIDTDPFVNENSVIHNGAKIPNTAADLPGEPAASHCRDKQAGAKIVYLEAGNKGCTDKAIGEGTAKGIHGKRNGCLQLRSKNSEDTASSSLLDSASDVSNIPCNTAEIRDSSHQGMLDSVIETGSFHSGLLSTITGSHQSKGFTLPSHVSKLEDTKKRRKKVRAHRPLGASKEEVAMLNKLLTVVGSRIHSPHLSMAERQEILRVALEEGIEEEFVHKILDQTAGIARWEEQTQGTLSTCGSTENSTRSKHTAHSHDTHTTTYTKDTESIDYTSFRRFERTYHDNKGIKYGCIEDLKSSLWMESEFDFDKMVDEVASLISEAFDDWRRQRREKQRKSKA